MFDPSELPMFYQVASLLILAAAVGMLGLLARQPLIVSFIAVGILAGPSALGLAESGEHLHLLAELGIALLLFLVGLKLDFNMVRQVGLVALATGLGQVSFTAFFGFIICLALGLDWVTSVYIAVALTFSSTIIIVKLLSDKGEVGSLHGRIALGFLIVQDIVVVVAMVVLSTIGIGADVSPSGLGVSGTLISAALTVLGVIIFIRYLANPLVEKMAGSPELLVSFAIGWAACLAALGDFLGFGKELGGLLAGVSLASTPFRDAISTRLSSLRDFLLLFFFIVLGAGLDLSTLGDDMGRALVLSFFVLIGNPLIVLAIMGFMGYRRRTGFLAGLTVAQISEFSLIFMAMGVTIGHVTERAVGLVTLVGLVTIAVSVYMITYSHQLYKWLGPYLGWLERRNPFRENNQDELVEEVSKCDVIVFGLGRYGGIVARILQEKGYKVLGIDFSPAVVKLWREEGLHAAYGDIADPEFPGTLPLEHVTWVVSTVPDHDFSLTHEDPRLALVRGLQEHGYRGKLAVAATTSASMRRLEGKGIDVILNPYRDAADEAVEFVTGNRQPHDIDLIEPEQQKELQQAK